MRTSPSIPSTNLGVRDTATAKAAKEAKPETNLLSNFSRFSIWTPPYTQNSARDLPIPSTVPCVVCGGRARWDHHGIWRCVVCWPPEAFTSQGGHA